MSNHYDFLNDGVWKKPISRSQVKFWNPQSATTSAVCRIEENTHSMPQKNCAITYNPARRRDFSQSISTTTINNYIRNLKAFFTWYADTTQTTNPTVKIKQLRNERKAQEYLEDHEIEKLLKIFDRSYFPEHRDFMVIMLILDTGMRIGECLQITTDDLDMDDRTITLTGNLILTVMLAFAEYERGMIVEHTQTGKAVARQDPNFREGRPRKYTAAQLCHALDLLESGHSYKQVEAMTGVSKSTLIREKRHKRAPAMF